MEDRFSVLNYQQLGPDDKPQAFAARHALALVELLGDDIPILLVQGANDRIVPAEQARTMFNTLLATGRVEDDCKVYPHGAHGFLFWDDPSIHPQEELIDTEKAWQDILAFMDQRVKEPDWDWD